jgi:G3E family GTPase
MHALPVTVVTGFLGAGKTTLVNRWLADLASGDVAVIVNELGAVGVDGALLAARAQTLVEIAGGCVCCSTQAELVRALEVLAAQPVPPKRVLIETSGAASPAGVLRAVAARDDAWQLDGIITVVDAARAEQLAEHDLAIEQVGYADVVVLSRADVCEAVQCAHAKDVIATHNGAAVIVTAVRGDSAEAPTLEALLALRRESFTPARAIAPTKHVYESLCFVAGFIDGERFADFMERDLAQFSGRLFRTKGILAVAGVAERMIVQGVADMVEVSLGEPWADTTPTSRFVIVGFGLDRDALSRAFDACVVERAALSSRL